MTLTVHVVSGAQYNAASCLLTAMSGDVSYLPFLSLSCTGLSRAAHDCECS